MNRNACPCPYPDVLYREEPGQDGAVLVKATGLARRLNATGRLIWVLCDGTRTRQDILGALRAYFDEVEEEVLARDLDEFIADLVAHRFLWLLPRKKGLSQPSVEGLRPEDELLLCCAGSSAKVGRMEALLRRDLDWAYLLQRAFRHGLMPLLYQSLSAACPQAVPDSALTLLRDQFQANARRNLSLTEELLALLSLFEAHGIPAVPYKGPALAASVYGDIALRQFCDLDILVHKRDVLRVKDLLLSRGYRPEFPLTRAQEAALLRYDSEYAFVRPDTGSMVELHWEIMPRYFPFSLDSERLWERLELISIRGREVPSLSPEDLLLILCVHSAKHLWGRLLWVCDVARVISAYEGMDWGRVMGQARALGGERMLFLGLSLVGELLGATVPGEVWRKVQADRAVESLAAQVQEWLFSEGGPPQIFAGAVFHPFHIQVRERFRDKLRYCLRLATVPKIADWLLLPLPPPLFPLYRLLRPIWLLGRYGWSALKRFLRF